VREIAANPEVAFTIYGEHEDITKIQSVTLKGAAMQITEEAEIRHVGEMILRKFPEFTEIGPNPDLMCASSG